MLIVELLYDVVVCGCCVGIDIGFEFGIVVGCCDEKSVIVLFDRCISLIWL